MFGDLCCTFIPNNTAPDGSVTKALEGLRKLFRKHSGVNNFTVTCGCCCIPCARALFIRVITSITERHDIEPLMMPILAGPDLDHYEDAEIDFCNKG